MRSMFTTLVLGLALAACGDTGPNGNGDTDGPTGGGACETVADCPSGSTCLAYGGGPGVCTPECSVSADECGGEATCAGVGSLQVDVCQDPEKVADEGEVPSEEETPRIPCSSDADCSAYGADAICATWKGMSDCTLRCDAETDCDLPAMGGITMDFYTCLPDEADESRGACVPDEDCFADPMSCVSMPGF